MPEQQTPALSEQLQSQQRTLPNALLGTVQIEPATTVEQTGLQTAFAQDVSLYELLRTPDNNGKAIPGEYIQNQKAVRRFFVDHFVDGSLYESTESFSDLLQEAHTLAAANDAYNAQTGKQLEKSVHGKFRTGIKTNKRITSAQLVADIAAKYNDPYANVFTQAEPYDTKHNTPELTLLSAKALTGDYVEFGDDGVEVEDYMYVYPAPETITDYINAAYTHGKEACMHIQNGNTQETLEQLARQYQYLVTARPFEQINNSLFMNLVNAQIKLMGMQGIAHGDMDHVAMRFQPDFFVQYFKEQVIAGQATA
jgi:hypothetical protein